MRTLVEGEIKDVHKGATSANVEIELKGGETVISSRTNEAVDELDLKKGAKTITVTSDVMIAIQGAPGKVCADFFAVCLPVRSLAGYARCAAIARRWW
ncbi:MAG: TOBE domain-containing protein [Methylocella sp.]